jgi:pre-60S factor REI1
MKKMEEKKKNEENLKLQTQNLYCDVCEKKFNSIKKLNEHLSSKTHLKNKNKKEEEDKKKEDEKNEISTSTENKDEKKEKEPEKTTLDDVTICLFCNVKNENLKENMYHMVQKHKLDIPFVLYIKSYTDLLKLLAKKIFTYHACLTCDTQRFETNKALQSHMLDKSHTSINEKDLDEFLFKYYDLKKLLSIKDKNIRRLKEFKILSLRARVAKELKEKNLDGDDEWEEVKSNEGDDDYEPMTLPNGELLLEDGSTLGNKQYKIYYKQKFHINKFEELQKEHKERNKERNLRLKRRDQIRKNIKRHVNYKALKGSKKGNFDRINKLTVMRPQIALV